MELETVTNRAPGNFVWAVFCSASILFASALTADDAPKVTISENGHGAFSIIVSERASEATRHTAATLQDYLNRISGADFRIETSDSATGIAVGTASDFPSLNLEHLFAPEDAFRREDYLLRSSETGLLLIGATEQAVEHAVWDLLHRLGYRQFFSGETWEVVPHQPTLTISVDTFQKPDFYTRRIWYGHGLWDYNKVPYQQWCARNRAVPGYGLSTGHSYGSIIRAH